MGKFKTGRQSWPLVTLLRPCLRATFRLLFIFNLSSYRSISIKDPYNESTYTKKKRSG